ncbi:ATP-binding protein [Caldichromatium japonicum]|uniref:ATP-binding protein n=1 Tax=Caldichromatium japonicum TaxID=2699430 RepID=UPI0031B570EA
MGLATGLAVWAALDQIQGRQVDKIFDRELAVQLKLRARESLIRFERYLASYAAVIRLLAHTRWLSDYLQGSDWLAGSGATQPTIHRGAYPDWLSEPFMRDGLNPPTHLLLTGLDGAIWEIFQTSTVPIALDLQGRAPKRWFGAHPGSILIERLAQQLYLVVAEAIKDAPGKEIGYLVAIVPIDAALLAASQHGLDVGSAAVALVDDTDQRLLASLDPQAIPVASHLSDWAASYVITAQSLDDYIAPDSKLSFATLVSQARVEKMSHHVRIFERRQRFYAAVVFVLVFTALFYLVSARLNSILKRMTRFAQRALGIPEPGFARAGNQLILLEEWIQHFTQLVLAAREEMSRRYQAELREREALKAAMMEASLDAIVTLDHDGRIIEYNPAAERLFGIERSQALGVIFAERFLADLARPAFRRLLDRSLHRYLAPQGREELLALDAAGREIPVELSIAPIEQVGARFFTLYIHDISSRKQAEQEIKSLARLASESPNPILRVSATGSLVYANPASHTIVRAWGSETGWLLPEDWADAVKAALVLGRPLERELEVGGQIYAILLAPIRDLGYVNIYARDITAVRRAEQEARQHQAALVHVCRLSTLGEIATGMAHELNQPLSAVINYANGCSRRLHTGQGRPEELIEAMHQIIAQAQRASEIIKRLRALVGKQPPVRAEADLNQLVHEVCTFLAFEINQLGVGVALELLPEPLKVLVDVVQIEQVLLNLVTNALDAMESCPAGARRLGIRTWREGAWARLAVADTGPGIDPEQCPKVFAPFVTTKTGGMGMGLAISQTIIENHEGRIWAESIPEQGATFHIRLPLAPVPAQALANPVDERDDR